MATFGATPKSLNGHRVFVALQDRISSGEYPPGIWLPAERVLADEFGVKRAVVRNAFLRLEQEGKIAREPGHRPWVCGNKGKNPDEIDLGTVPSELRTIAAIMPQHPIYHASTQILNSINLELRTEEAPYRLTVYNSYGENAEASIEYEKRALLDILDGTIAGVVIWHVGHEATLPYLIQLQEKGVPVVYVDRYPTGLSCDFIGVDNRESAAEAVRYLMSIGHTRIAHITTAEQSTTVRERKQGYLDALRSGGIVPKPEWMHIRTGIIISDMVPAVRQFFGLAEPPTAVFTLNDALAHYFIAEAESAGHLVPDTLSVLGFDNLEQYSPRPAMLTTMHQPFDRIGRRAAGLLLQRLNSAGTSLMPNQHIMLSAPLVVRSTCQPPGKEDRIYHHSNTL